MRNFITPFPDLEPRTFRMDAAHAAVVHPDVNVLPKCVGGAWSHADMKTPRFTAVDFQLVTAMQRAKDRNPGLEVPGFFADASSANFADWPFPYEELEPFVRRGGAADRRVGRRLESLRAAAVRAVSDAGARGHVRRDTSCATGRAGRRSTAVRSRRTSSPPAIASRFYPSDQRDLERPPCNQCGPCSGFGCPNHAKGSPAVTSLRRALLTGKCQLRFNCHVATLRNDGGTVTGVEYVDGQGTPSDRRRRRLRAGGVGDRVGAAVPALADTGRRHARQLQRPGRAEPHVPLPDQRERVLPAPRARPARPGGHQRTVRLPRRRARWRGGAGVRHPGRPARLPRRHLRVQRVAGAHHHRGRRRLLLPAPAARATDSRSRTRCATSRWGSTSSGS